MSYLIFGHRQLEHVSWIIRICYGTSVDLLVILNLWDDSLRKSPLILVLKLIGNYSMAKGTGIPWDYWVYIIYVLYIYISYLYTVYIYKHMITHSIQSIYIYIYTYIHTYVQTIQVWVWKISLNDPEFFWRVFSNDCQADGYITWKEVS